MALCSSAAATDESTPPESPSNTRDLPTLRADLRDGVGDEILRRPVLLRAANADEEIADHVHAALGVENLRVKLDAVETALRVLDAGERRILRVVPWPRNPAAVW